MEILLHSHKILIFGICMVKVLRSLTKYIETRFLLKFIKKCLQSISESVIVVEHGRLVKGLRRRPLTAETRVRFPYRLSN